MTLNVTEDEHERALDELIGELTREDMLLIPGVRAALADALRGLILVRARERRVLDVREAVSRDLPDVPEQDIVHRLIPDEHEGTTACGADPNADGGSDADPAWVTCVECRALAEALPRTRTRDRRKPR